MPDTMHAPELLDLSDLTEKQQLAFYGALFALAAADDSIDERESQQIVESFHLEGLSEDARTRAFALSISPPSLQTCLEVIKDTDLSVRRSMLLNLVDVALADGEIEPGEPLALEAARVALGLEEDELEAMHTYAYRLRQQKGEQAARPFACPADLG